MKSLNLFFGIFALAIVSFLGGCSDDTTTNPDTSSTAKMTCVINGSGYTNFNVALDKSGVAVYNTGESMTVCSFGNAAGETGGVVFEKNKTGVIAVDKKSSILLTLDNNKNIITLTDGNINVTSYGNVGGFIEGTFSGNGFVSKSNGIPESITITKGTFKAARAM